MSADDSKSQQKEVWAEDINGIIYYLDAENNVYKTEDVKLNKRNPEIVGRCHVVAGVYKRLD